MTLFPSKLGWAIFQVQLSILPHSLSHPLHAILLRQHSHGPGGIQEVSLQIRNQRYSNGVFWVHCPLPVHEYNYTKPALSDVIIEEKAPLSYLFAPLAYTPQKDVVHARPGRPGTRVMLKL
ncbi:hypothetical protein JOM56_009721 [Amanita muscaria]